MRQDGRCGLGFAGAPDDRCISVVSTAPNSDTLRPQASRAVSTMMQKDAKSRTTQFSFESRLENEEEIVDALLVALSRNQLDASVWQSLHEAAVRDDRVSELAFAYESLAAGRKLKTFLPAVQAELFFRAATFFGDVLGDEFGATTYLERALGAQPGHVGAFERIDAQLTRTDDNKRLAELCAATGAHRPKPEQLVLMKRAAVLYERAGLEDKAIETYQQLVKLDPSDESLRNALEARYVKANRFRDVARMLEQALAADPAAGGPSQDDADRIRGKLVDVFANQLKEPERAMPHVEVLLEHDPTHAEARKVATRLLESKGLAARAAAALAFGAATVELRAKYLGVELEHTRGPRRRDVLRRLGILRQDDLGDIPGAFEAFEQALGIDPGDDELRRRYIELGTQLKGPLEVARTFARVSTVAKDAAVRSRITAEMGALLLQGNDLKRARTTLVGVVSAPAADGYAVLTAARALATVYENEGDTKNLLDVLAKVGEHATDEAERLEVNERVALAASEIGDTERSLAAWRRLVETPARERALAALEPIYEQRSDWINLSFVLEQRAKGERSGIEARKLSFRAAEILTTRAKDSGSASEAWRTMIETYGPARDVYAQWVPILEAAREWPALAEALDQDAALAPAEEQAGILARLGHLHLTKTKSDDAAIDAFRRALAVDPQEKTSRGTLEKLLTAGDHRGEAASVLEPIYRAENNAPGLLRVLELRASLEPIVQDRLLALEEAADVAADVSRDKAVEIVARGLGEAVESDEPTVPWLDRFDRHAEGLDAKKRAALLGTALGDRPITSGALLLLARRVGEEHAASGDVAAALAAFRRALAFEPGSQELIHRVDELLQEQGNPEERVALYRNALEQSPSPERRKKLLHSIGSIERYELQQPGAAIGAYKRALKDDPTDAEAYAALVDLYTETEAFDDLCDVLEDHLPECATPEEARRTRAQLADVAARHGDRGRAALHAGALLADDTIGPQELALVERVAMVLGDAELLRRTLERRVRDAGEPEIQIATLERLANIALETNDAERAVERLRQAAEIAASTGDDPGAIQLYTKLRAIAPRDADATKQLAQLHERAESWKALPELYETLLGLAEDDDERVALERRRARLYAERLGDPRRAFAALRDAFALAPTDRELLGELEEIAKAAGTAGDLAVTIDDAVGNGIEAGGLVWGDLVLAKARVLASEPRLHADAAKTFRTVMETADDPSHVSAAAEGFEALVKGDPPGEERTTSLRWLHKWRVDLAGAEKRARAMFVWAQAEETEIGDVGAALSLYRQVLELDENDLDALSAVSRLSLASGDVEGALAALMTRRLASEGEARHALDVQIATILVDRPGRQREALDRVAGVLETQPHDKDALELAAKLLRHSEVAVRAAEVLEKSLDVVDDPELRVEILKRLCERDDGEPRLDFFERLLDLLKELERPDEAFDFVLKAASGLPDQDGLWDRAEALARQLSRPEPLANLYEDVLRRDREKEQQLELGQRAVAFFEEWFEDGGRVVDILERLLEIEPHDMWAFDRLKLLFDARERWDDLFALYDRAAESADRERRIELLEEAAQIAKDFANHSKRAIGYFEQLLDLRPGNARLSGALERLYERHGCHRELITLLGNRLPDLAPEDAQRERGRIASLWLDELGDPSSALIVIEDIIAHQTPEEQAAPAALPNVGPGKTPSILPPPERIDVVQLLERVLGLAPMHADIRESVPPPPEGQRRASYAPVAPTRGLVRQRAASLLRSRYGGPGHEGSLARVLEVELEAVVDVKDRIARHLDIAAIYIGLNDDERALEHYVQLVLLEPEASAHRTELASLAARVGRYDRLADVLVAAAEDCDEVDSALRVDLLIDAAVVCTEKLGDHDRAIDLFFSVLNAEHPVGDSARLTVCRNLAPLLAQTTRKSDHLDVLEKLAVLEDNVDTRWRVLGEAALLATELEEDDRAIWAWEGRLQARPDDLEALDGLAVLFEKGKRWADLIEVLKKRAAREDRSAEQRRHDRVRVASLLSEKLDASEPSIGEWRGIEGTFGEADDVTRALAALFRHTKQSQELAVLLARAAERATAAGSPANDRAKILTELGDVQREQLDEIAAAIASYERALLVEPRTEGARIGLRSLLKRSEHRADVVRVLLAAYYAADDWRLVLDLTEHRLNAAKDVPSQIAILMEASRLSESRAQDIEAAFSLVRRAVLLDPGNEASVTELFRLTDLTRGYRQLADALAECLEITGGVETPWSKSLRFRMGDVLEARLDELEPALDAFVHVSAKDPEDLEAARAVIRVAAKTSRWDASARVVIDSTRALAVLPPELLAAIEEAAKLAAATAEGGRGNTWDAITSTLASAVADATALAPGLSRDVEAAIAVWHRDRRGDPDAAESAFTRALGYDATNATLLADLASLQRRARGRPLVESLLRLSQTTGGDLDLLTEAADTALGSVGDRALAKSIFDRLLKLGAERWLGATEPNVTSGTPKAPETYVDRAVTELVKIHGEEGDHDRVVTLLVDASHLPWPTAKSRSLRHEAARIAEAQLETPDRAIVIYDGLVKEDPHDDDAVARLVAIYERRGRRSDLLALKRSLVGTARSEDERLRLRLEIAELEDMLSEPARAILALEENLGEAPRHAATVKELSILLLREGRLSELEALWAKQADLARDANETTLAADLYGRAAEVAESKLGDVAAAIGHLRSLVALEPRPPALDALARLSTQIRDHEAASGYLDRLRDLTNDEARADITLRLADALALANRRDDARARLEDEVSRDPESDRVRMRLAEMVRAAQDWPALAQLLTDGAAHAPDKATRLSRLREAAELHRLRTGNHDKAIPLLEQASDLAPDDNAVKLALADALGAAGRFEEARTLLRSLVEAFGGRRPKERAPVHYHLARLDLAVGDRARALVELDAATRIDPANPQILRALAELARDDGQFDRAERSYRALLTVLRRQEDTPDDAPITRSEVMFELAQIAERQGEADRAKEILESAFELSTENIVEARRLESALRKKGDDASLARALEARLQRAGAEALSDLQVLLGKVPDAAEVLTELGRLYEEHLGREEDAYEMHLRSLDLDASSETAHAATARLGEKLGKLDAYRERIRVLADRANAQGRHHDPELAAALYLRLAKFLETRDAAEAAKLYELAATARPQDKELLDALDRVYEKLGDDAGQARALGMRVALESEDTAASATLYRLAGLRFRTGDIEAGVDAYDQAYAREPDPTRAEELLRAAADANPQNERVVERYEQLARLPGNQRMLVDALVRRWSLPNATTASMREAVELAQSLNDTDLADSLLRRWLEGNSDDKEGRVWALSLLATICEERGKARPAVMLRREAADIAEPEEARRLLFQVARTAAGALEDLGLAASIYEELLERDPVDKDAWQPLIDVFRRMGNFDKLAQLLVNVVGYVDDAHERSKLRLERVEIGMQKLGLSDEDAARDLRDIVDEDPSATGAAILLGTILERSGREEDLAELLARQLDAAKDRQDAEAVSSLSRRLGQLLEPRDPQQARDVYYAALDWDPKARELLVALERLHAEANELDARADIMEKRLALESGSDAEVLALELSQVRDSQRDPEGAVRALEIGFRASPASRMLRDRLETLYREQLEYEKLGQLYVTDARARATPNEKALRLRDAARIYRDDLSNPDEGAKILREARETDPTNAEVLGELIDMLTAAGELRSADAELTSAIEAMREDGGEGEDRLTLVGRRAGIRSRLGDGEGALEDYETAVAGGRDELRSGLGDHLAKLAISAAGRGDTAGWKRIRLRLADLRLAMGDVEEARNVLTELLKTDSKDKATLRAIAHVDELEERWAEACATYRRLVGLEDEEGIVSAALKLADVCEKAGRLGDARGGLERARMAKPDDATLRERLAWLYEQLGATVELATLVLEEARAAGDVAPRFEGLLRAGQLFLEHMQDPQTTAQIGPTAAIDALEEAHALRPADLDCAALLADAYVGAGRFEEAQDLLSRTIGTFKGRRARELSALYHRLARIAEMLGDRITELQHLTTALDMDGQNGIVASELAYVAMEVGNWDVAQRALRAVTMLKAPAPLPKALAYQHLAEIARHQGDTKRAMMLVKRAIDDDPTLESARALLEEMQQSS